MDAKQLMDSRRFCLLMDNLCAVWSKKRAADEDKEYQLAEVLKFIGVNAAAVTLAAPPAPTSPVYAPPQPPIQSQDEMCREVCASAHNVAPGGDGVRWVSAPIDLETARLGAWIEANKPGVAVSENHPIGLNGGPGMRESWSIPFIG
jgi:hypothetical protein